MVERMRHKGSVIDSIEFNLDPNIAEDVRRYWRRMVHSLDLQSEIDDLTTALDSNGVLGYIMRTGVVARAIADA